MIEARMRTRVHPDEVEAKKGKILTPGDWNMLLTGPAFLRRPDGRPLAIYLPGVMSAFSQDEGVYGILKQLSLSNTTNNRGLAGGSPRLSRGSQKRTYALAVNSVIAGAIDPGGVFKYCRTTAWTGRHLPEWQSLQPMLKTIAGHLANYVPDRYAAQQAEADRTDPAWVVPGTPFSTITVNNSYPTGVHTDKGDLDAGFSSISCLRRGGYAGGQLCFPEYRVAVDLQDGDLILMDAHEWHGNAHLICGCGSQLKGPCKECGAERISVVAYFRTKMTRCGSPDDELQKARESRDVATRATVSE